MVDPQPVSVHGGHSGQFCSHAKGTLEEMVLAYIDHGYPWVGITEHMPPVSDDFLYPEEIRQGVNAAMLNEQFGDYIASCRKLQDQYKDRIQILVGFETEDYSGSIDLAKRLIERYSPDYVVGSIHHVKDIPFDYSPQWYRKAADRCGGVDDLYISYFEQQYSMIQLLRPDVVGHLDIIRIYDPDYRARLTKPAIWTKIVRNLQLIKQLDLILDFNLRPLSKGGEEPYLSAPILDIARKLSIDVVPGEDSHSVDEIGVHMNRAIEIIKKNGLTTNWRKPA